jgi:hypothetical protein
MHARLGTTPWGSPPRGVGRQSPRLTAGLLLLCLAMLPAGVARSSESAGICRPPELARHQTLVGDGQNVWLSVLPASRPSAERILDKDGPAARSLTGRTDTVDPAAEIPPGLAFLMSAAVPGAGQLAEGRNRAFVYLGLEVLAWVSHFAYLDAGNKKEGEYEAYARRHWDIDDWEGRALADSCLSAVPAGVDFEKMKETLIDHLEAGDLQHYYEDIGKLEAYRAGWDDFVCENPDELSPNRRTYRSMRADSNDYLEKARFAKTMAFLNRIVSAVDAFRTAKGAKVSLSQSTTLELQVAGSLEKPRARLRIRRCW